MNSIQVFFFYYSYKDDIYIYKWSMSIDTIPNQYGLETWKKSDDGSIGIWSVSAVVMSRSIWLLFVAVLKSSMPQREELLQHCKQSERKGHQRRQRSLNQG